MKFKLLHFDINKILLLSLLGILLMCSAASAASGSYSILPNVTGYDLYTSQAEPGEYILMTDGGNYSPDYTMFEMYDNFSDMLPVINGSIIPRATTNCTTPTPDGSGQVVHPSVVKFDSPWHGYEYWMIITGYIHADSMAENPLFMCSHDGNTWTVPSGVTNPLRDPSAPDYCSDANLAYDDDLDSLYIIYREFNVSTQTSYIHARRYNGTLGDEFTVVSEIKSVENDIDRSPSVVIKDGVYHWFAGDRDYDSTVAYRTSIDGVNYSAPVGLNIVNDAGNSVWHLDVHYIPEKSKWVMLVLDGLNLYFSVADTPDGVWESYPAHVLRTNTVDMSWDQWLYKSCFVYNATNDNLDIWYSGWDTANVDCYIGRTQYAYEPLMNYLQNGNFCIFGGQPDITVSNDYISVRNGGIGTLNNTYQMLQSYASFKNAAGIGFNDIYGTSAAFAKYKSYIRQADTMAGFSSTVGNGATYTVAESTYPRDTAWHTFQHYKNGTSAVDSVTWENSITANAAIPRGMWLFDGVDARYAIQTNKSISSAYTPINNDMIAINVTDKNCIYRGYLPSVTSSSDNVGIRSYDDLLLIGGITNVDSSGVHRLVDPAGTTGTVADFLILPSTNDVNVLVSTWSNTQKVWTLSSETQQSVTHTIGGFPANTDIQIKRDGVDYETVTSNETGYIEWVYDGGFSEHTFEATVIDDKQISSNFAQYFNSIFNRFYRIIFQLPMRLI